MDTLTPDKRSRLMAKIRDKDAPKPEWIVRRLIHSMGFRFRLHRKDLPGGPDSCVPCNVEGHLCSRVLLASTSMPLDYDTENQRWILEQ